MVRGGGVGAATHEPIAPRPGAAIRGCPVVATVPSVLYPLVDVACHVTQALGGVPNRLRADGPGAPGAATHAALVEDRAIAARRLATPRIGDLLSAGARLARYLLDLPAARVPAGTGAAHMHRCLAALALFGTADEA